MPATLTRGYSFGATEQVTNTKLHNLVDLGSVSGLDQTNLVAGSGIVVSSVSSPSDTDALWLDTSGTITLKYYNGSSWVAVSGSSIPTNHRLQMYVMQASTTTITVAPGLLEVNGQAISKTANTTLTISTAGDWAGGSSLRNTNTTAYVGVDASGNIKMHTSAPTNADYAMTITAANNTKRYVTWSGTVYRVIGWFRMNGTGSGELDTFGVSNIADGSVKNVVEFETGAFASGTTIIPADNTIPQITEGDQYMSQVFVPTNVNNKLRIDIVFFGDPPNTDLAVALFQDATANALAVVNTMPASGYLVTITFSHYMKAGTTSLTTFKVRAGCGFAGTTYFNGYSTGVQRYNGSAASSIRVEEIEAQLT